MAGNLRIFDQIVDIGAYEYQGYPDSAVITGQPPDTIVCPGTDAAFRVAAKGAGLHDQWQFSIDNGKTWQGIKGGTTETLRLSNLQTSDSGTWYRVVVTGDWNTGTSEVAVLRVNSPVLITTQPKNTTLCAGDNAGFMVKTIGTNLTYQWRSSMKGANRNNIGGASSASLHLSNPRPSTSGTEYRIVVSGTCNEVTSKAVKLIVNPLPKITIVVDGDNPVSKEK